jgi:hypothetical protein
MHGLKNKWTHRPKKISSEKEHQRRLFVTVLPQLTASDKEKIAPVLNEASYNGDVWGE